MHEFRVPTAGADPFDIAAGPGGTMWLTEFEASKIGRISPSGQITEYPVPSADAGPYQIAVGPGGFILVHRVQHHQGRPDGQVTENSLPRPSCGGTGIASGPARPFG